MDANTLNLYSVAAGLSICLSLVMAIFARFENCSPLIGRFALGLLVLTAGFFLAGIGLMLPVWGRVVVSNLVLLAAAPILYSGIAAYCAGSPARTDRWGWAVVAASAPAFVYWGLMEPNGMYRSVVFSLAVALIHVRSARDLLRAAVNRIGGIPTWVLAALFGALVIWMLLRCAHLLTTDQPGPQARSGNPTQWLSVFGYVVLVSLTSICVMWMEANLKVEPTQSEGSFRGGLVAFFGYFRHKLLLLWSAVIVLCFAVIGALSIAYVSFHDHEMTRLTRTAETLNEVFAHHVRQVVSSAQIIMQAVSAVYAHTGSLAQTQTMLRSVSAERFDLTDIAVITDTAQWVAAHDRSFAVRCAMDAACFATQLRDAEPHVRIVYPDPGQDSADARLLITQRIEFAVGTSGGVVVASVGMESLKRLFNEWLGQDASFAALMDRESRASIVSVAAMTVPPTGQWSNSPWWPLVNLTKSGRFQGTLWPDGPEGYAVFSTVSPYPLVMITGYSVSTLSRIVNDRLLHISLIAAVVLAFILLLGALFTAEAKRRNEQDRFMSMLSHELKTPIAVIQMLMGSQGVPMSARVRVDRALADMNLIIERCLQSDRLKFGRVRFRPSRFEISMLLQEVRDQSVEPARVIVHDCELQPCMTDVELLRIILSNLVDNAIKYGAQQANVDVTAKEQPRGKRRGILVEVVNAIGPAGAPDSQRAFGKYYRGERARGKSGSGLGLHIAAELTALAGGTITFESSDREVRFFVWIPV